MEVHNFSAKLKTWTFLVKNTFMNILCKTRIAVADYVLAVVLIYYKHMVFKIIKMLFIKLIYSKRYSLLLAYTKGLDIGP